ncbi:MAG TPA: hypothetical protein VGG64_21100 [Pirellulales bacterium]|jgi:hypothetical protein
MAVQVNELGNLPHHDGQLVLKAEREDFEVQIIRHSEGYTVYGIVHADDHATLVNLAAERATPEAARDLARRLWREGKDFNVWVGGEPAYERTLRLKAQKGQAADER